MGVVDPGTDSSVRVEAVLRFVDMRFIFFGKVAFGSTLATLQDSWRLAVLDVGFVSSDRFPIWTKH